MVAGRDGAAWHQGKADIAADATICFTLIAASLTTSPSGTRTVEILD